MSELIFGNKWKVVKENIGKGGQSTVHLVQDVTDPTSPNRALKLFLSRPQRDKRFLSEIEACKTLKHPHVINLIDHSALDEDEQQDKMYLVTEYAADGNLTSRAKLYENQIDSTIYVAKILALALKYAHDCGIKHRDVKPDNILFTGKDHNCLISDFGICLIRGNERNTLTGEVVGPRIFMAPELEDGGQLEVKESADVYSLGKVIYFMLSGGRIFAREKLFAPEYDIFKEKGKLQLIRSLLGKMICDDSVRIQKMEEVIKELTFIQEWDTNKGYSPELKVVMETMKVDSQKMQSAIQVQRDLVKEKNQKLTDCIEIFKKWLPEYLDTLMQPISDEKTFDVRRINANIIEGTIDLKPQKCEILYQVGISVEHKNSNNQHFLIFILIKPLNMLSGNIDETDTEIKVLPIYIVHGKNSSPKQLFGYFNRNQNVAGLDVITKSMIHPYAYIFNLTVNGWSSKFDELKQFIQKILALYLKKATADEFYIDP